MTQTMLQIHQQAVAGHSPVFHDFLLAYKPHKHEVYAFVEGKDDPVFYRGLFDSILPNHWEAKFIKAGNKDRVLKVFSDFDWARFNPKRICFFVDRDLSDFLVARIPISENLYVTDGYSIENDVVNFSTFKRVMEEVLNLTDCDDKEWDSIFLLFSNNHDLFLSAISPLMAQILLWRRNENLRPQLDNIDIKVMFSYADGRASLRPNYIDRAARVDFASTSAGVIASTEDDIDAAELELADVRRYVRGKYLLTFFVSSLLAIHQAIPIISQRYRNPPKAKLSFGPKNAIVLIGPRARCPNSLRDFVSKNYLAYIAGDTVLSTHSQNHWSNVFPDLYAFYVKVLKFFKLA